MISITISKSENRYYGFELNGHAKYRRYGKDVVCSAVSVLIINTVNSIERFTEDAIKCEASPDGGYIHVEFSEENSLQLKLLMDSMCLGLEKIQKEYGSKYIELLYKEV
ncbi:MAG: ribosomal-processing cysteine protease Prp [Pseudobutyrivibrio sp.]|nr:ribosomal-processing cysteine protease Prp [Clostridia bacterium]MCF0130161.1 ribosomal-processing cysteine protease Prp [Pseudobutyrivibrio sp.]